MIASATVLSHDRSGGRPFSKTRSAAVCRFADFSDQFCWIAGIRMEVRLVASPLQKPDAHRHYDLIGRTGGIERRRIVAVVLSGSEPFA